MSRIVLVTGSEGFLGRHVVTELSRWPDLEVVRIVRPGSAVDHEARTRVVRADALDGTGVDRIVRTEPDVLVHLAWEGLSDFRSPQHLDQVADHSRLIEALVSAGIERIVGVGTCLEYGLVEGELDESMPTRPVVAYGQGKARLSEHLERLATDAGVAWCWPRVFYPFGPGQQPRSLWSALNSAIDRGEREFPMSGGAQVRDYLEARVVGRILALLALSDRVTGPINVCSGQPVTVLDLVERWIAERQSDIIPKLGVFPYPDYEPMSFWGSRKALDVALAPAHYADDVDPTRATPAGD